MEKREKEVLLFEDEETGCSVSTLTKGPRLVFIVRHEGNAYEERIPVEAFYKYTRTVLAARKRKEETSRRPLPMFSDRYKLPNGWVVDIDNVWWLKEETGYMYAVSVHPGADAPGVWLQPARVDFREDDLAKFLHTGE